MINIDQVDWGELKVSGKEYSQVLVVGNQVIERQEEKLRRLFGTTHKMGGWEMEELLSSKPEIIIIGNGFDGVLEVSKKLRAESEKLGIELKVLKTPAAVGEFNQLVGKGKRVNALIHTTC
ncbi:MAG TPA: MTH938/NDUFAF3 family protein [Clostridia bacterium]|nr:MTH938/NDUFAF3 family protein [Clostridia bacterium]